LFHKPLSNEVKYFLKRHNDAPLSTKFLSLLECSRIIHPKKDTLANISGLKLVVLVE